MACFWSVSYTHLDVYKRQAKQLEDSEIIKEIVDYSRVLLEEDVQELTMAKDLALSLIHI